VKLQNFNIFFLPARLAPLVVSAVPSVCGLTVSLRDAHASWAFVPFVRSSVRLRLKVRLNDAENQIFLSPPGGVRSLGLAENPLGLSSVDLEKVTVGGAHALVEFGRDIVELNQLLRQIASSIGKMQEPARGVAILLRSCVPHRGVEDDRCAGRDLDQ
jgi:hypothetical protein